MPVQLSDTDVESVIRKIILQKSQSAIPAIQQTLTDTLGEISRHLRGTRLEHSTEDETFLVDDYPLLPVRRRFWEKVLHKLDESGTISQLRNQLRIVHEAACATAEQPLGQVVAGDFIYDQLSTDLLQTGLLSREVYDRIGKLAAGDQDDRLKASLLKLIYLIGKLPTDPMADIGLRATEDSLADLLVTELAGGSSALRKRIPGLLDALHNSQGLVMAIATPSGTEYRLQTAESSAWHDEYRKQVAELSANTQRLEMERVDLLKGAYREPLNAIHLTQGLTRQDSHWLALDPEQRQAMLASHNLNGGLALDLSSPDSILDELERCSLAQWPDRTQALKGRFEQARMDAARRLEPKVQRVDLPRRTLTDEAELADWLAETEARIRAKLEDGPVMI